MLSLHPVNALDGLYGHVRYQFAVVAYAEQYGIAYQMIEPKKPKRSIKAYSDNVVHRPRLLSDNGLCYISRELADYLDDKGMTHTRGAPYHPQTQGKIERWHQTLKNRILLENYFLPGDLEARIAAFVGYYNHQRYHESLKNITPADVYTGCGQTILLERKKTKRRTMKLRRLQHAEHAA